MEQGPRSYAPGYCMKPFLRAFPEEQEIPSNSGSWNSIQVCLATFNTLSLLEGSQAQFAGLHGAAGRPTLLCESLKSAGVHVAGLQECRTPAGTMWCGSFTRFSSGCDEHSCFGVELWVSNLGPCVPSSVVVLHSSPTRLIASACLGALQVQMLVGHAPHRAHSEAIRSEWWRVTRVTSHLCHAYSRRAPWIFLLDGNCRLGSRTSEAVGSHQADEEDDAGLLLHDLMSGLDLCAPAKFPDCMSGPGGTLFQKRNGALDRSDYVCVPSSWRQGPCYAWVDPNISAGHAGMDHLAAVTWCEVCLSLGQAHKRRAPRPDARAITEPANAARIERIIREAPRPSWEVEVSEHAATVVDYLYRALVAEFPLQKRRMRSSFFSEETTALHQAVATLRHAVRSRTQALRGTYLRCAFLAWHRPSSDFPTLFSGRWLWRLRTRLGHNCMLLRRFGRRLKVTCKADKRPARSCIELFNVFFDPRSTGRRQGTPYRSFIGPTVLYARLLRKLLTPGVIIFESLRVGLRSQHPSWLSSAALLKTLHHALTPSMLHVCLLGSLWSQPFATLLPERLRALTYCLLVYAGLLVSP